MSHYFLRLTSLILLTFMLVSCPAEDADSDCGNGVLEDYEACDGAQFADWLDIKCDASRDEYLDPMYLRCTERCQVDSRAACRLGRCGNGMIDEGEGCDGQAFPALEFSCENPNLSKLYCSACQIVDHGVCDEVREAVCGNGVLERGEHCDGPVFRKNVRVCPAGSDLVDPRAFCCQPDCKGVDRFKACRPRQVAKTCGNGVLEDGENCDGEEMRESVIERITCPSKAKFDRSRLTCTDCRIDWRKGCVADTMVLISELVPLFSKDEGKLVLDDLALEISNLMEEDVDLERCSLSLFDSNHLTNETALAGLGLPILESGKNVVMCGQKADEAFKGACTAVVDWQISASNDRSFLALSCPEFGYLDVINLGQMRVQMREKAAVNFRRHCDAVPIVDTKEALLDKDWIIDSRQDFAPHKGLGAHCLRVIDCLYKVSRTTLNDRSEAIDAELLLKIDAHSVQTSKSEALKHAMIQFSTGVVRDGQVTKTVHHMIEAPQSDPVGSDEAGFERYTGRLENWDFNQGFWADEEGTYVLDAAISFDQGKSFVHCGPKGLIKNYENFESGERHRLEVHYDDKGGICGDGQISASEVCDGKKYRPELLKCTAIGSTAVLAYPERLSCHCQFATTASACATPDPLCGNGQIDGEERCDGEAIAHQKLAATCPPNTHYHPERTQCRPNCDANMLASCIPTDHLVFDEFLVHYDEENVVDALALSIVLTSASALDTTDCALNLLDAKGFTLASIAVSELLPPTDTTAFIEQCRAIRVCSERSHEATIFEHCDALGRDKTFIELLPKTKVFQLSCGADVMDVFDAEGLRAAMHQNVSHGKAKESLPWPSPYVELGERMTLTYDVDISSIDFGLGCDESSNLRFLF